MSEIIITNLCKKQLTRILPIMVWMICVPMWLGAQPIKTTEVDFPILNGKMTLRGVLSEPENVRSDAPLLVLVSPPQPIDRDYEGLFKTLSDSLNSHGIITFRYDNRNFSDTINAEPDPERYTMHEAADDLHDALTFLKSRNRSIGLVGHSEGGSISIIETARNTDVKNLLLLATAGVSGEKFGYSQQILRHEFLFNKLTTQDLNRLKYSAYIPLHIFADNSDDEVAFSKLQAELRLFYKENYASGFFRTLSEDEYVEEIVGGWKKLKRGLAFTRYNPADYFPTIKCPVFIAYAKDDNLMHYQENQEALERILMEHRHFDYKSIAIDSVEHSFEDSGGIKLPPSVSVQKKYAGYKAGKGFSKLCKEMIAWIEEKQGKESK